MVDISNSIQAEPVSPFKQQLKMNNCPLFDAAVCFHTKTS